MTTRSQKRKTVTELSFGEFKTLTAEKNPTENLIAGPSKSPKVQPENLQEIKALLRKR